MTALDDLLRSHVDAEALPGAVALLTHGADVEVAAVGSQDAEGTAPVTRDSIFRIASMTTPITAATVVMLVEDGRLGLDDPIETWLPSSYRGTDAGHALVDVPDRQWARMPEFPSGAGGLVSTLHDYLALTRMLAGRGEVDGVRLLSPDDVRLMTTDHLTPAQRAASRLFLHGQGWGYGGSVDVDPVDPWVVPGRYGWVGATGTSAHLVPTTGDIAILLTQRATDSPVPSSVLTDFWTYAAGA